MKLFALKYKVKDIGVYEFQFVPPAWLTNDSTPDSNEAFKVERYSARTPPSTKYTKSKKSCIGIMIAVLALTLVTIVGLLFYSMGKGRRSSR